MKKLINEVQKRQTCIEDINKYLNSNENYFFQSTTTGIC